MAITPTYPGVYIEEVPSGVRPISGVATSIAAFVGNFSRGPTNEAVRIFSPSDFDREFGGLRSDSLASYAIAQFFLNGGGQAWVVRAIAENAETATVGLGDTNDTLVFTASAKSPGVWGNNIRIEIDDATTDPAASFNLTVSEVVNGDVVSSESFRNLTMAPADARYAAAVVNEGSKLISLTAPSLLNANRPAPTGTVSKLLTEPAPANLTGDLTVTVGAHPPVAITNPDPDHATIGQLAASLQSKIRAAHATCATVTVAVVGSPTTGAFLKVTAGTAAADDVVALSEELAEKLGFEPVPPPPVTGIERQNVQWYAVGSTSDSGKQLLGVAGTDGALPDAVDLIAALARFDPVDLFNILCVPDTDRLDDIAAAAVIAAATAYAGSRRAFYIVDPPNVPVVRDELPEIEAWLDANGTLRNANTAAYFPRPRIPDRLNEFRLRAVPASGTIAGVYARTDAERGVWKAPAGLDAQLRGVQQLETILTDPQNGVLNPLGLNCLRFFRAAGNIVWGARTLVGSDQLASQWKYIPVRRTTLFLEESLYRGTHFVVFEPNDEALWSQIRLNVGAFMQGLFLQGAFQGQTPRQAYLVKCDSETTTQADINLGIVNILVGFAPLKPAEFVIIRISQLAGQTQA